MWLVVIKTYEQTLGSQFKWVGARGSGDLLLRFPGFSFPEHRRRASFGNGRWRGAPVQQPFALGLNRQPHLFIIKSQSKWPVPSKPLVSLPEERLLASSSPPRRPASPLLPPVVSRSPTDTDLELWLFVRSADTRSPLSS